MTPPTHLRKRARNTTCGHARWRRCAGLSLAELVLALASTAFVGTAVAAMLHAVAYAAEGGNEQRDLVPKQRVSAARIADAVRGAKEVLELSTDEVTLWADDLDGDDDYDSDEIAWIKYDASNDRLEHHTADSTTHTSVAVPIGDIPTLDTTLSGAGEMAVTTWVRDVTAFSFAGDATPTATALVTWRQTVTVGGQSDSQVHAAEIGSSQ